MKASQKVEDEVFHPQRVTITACKRVHPWHHSESHLKFQCSSFRFLGALNPGKLARGITVSTTIVDLWLQLIIPVSMLCHPFQIFLTLS